MAALFMKLHTLYYKLHLSEDFVDWVPWLFYENRRTERYCQVIMFIALKHERGISNANFKPTLDVGYFLSGRRYENREGCIK
jgi:hypothetical protein